ncbi:MAG: carbohydrate kinase family protein [bacterium]|nr:carbohydrate kinase family protein [bacterium]
MHQTLEQERTILVAGRLYLELAIEQKRGRGVEKAEWHHAGDGGHLAVAAARLGASVSLFTQVGSTSHDDDMLRTLAGEGVYVGGVVRRAPAPRATYIQEEYHGADQPLALSLPAASALTAEDAEGLDHLLLAHRWLLLDASLPVDFLDALAARAQLCGLHTALCLKKLPQEHIPRRTWKNVDYVVASTRAIETMVRKANWPPAVVHDARLLCGMLPALRGVLIVRATSDLLVSDGREHQRLPLGDCAVVHVRGVCSVAAAALVVALSEERGLFEAARFAHAAVRFYITHEGTRAAMPLRREMEWRG